MRGKKGSGEGLTAGIRAVGQPRRGRTSAVRWPAAGAVRKENSGDQVTPSPTR